MSLCSEQDTLISTFQGPHAAPDPECGVAKVDSKHVTRRQLLVGLSSTLAGIGLATGCAGLSSSTTATTQATTANASVTPPRPKRGGTLVFGQLAPIQSTNMNSGVTAAGFKLSLFNALVGLDDRAQPVPSLAESWRLSDDRLTLTLKLRQGVTFHSGRPFTADAAKWSIEYTQDPKNGVAVGAELRLVQVRALDSATIQLMLPSVMPHIFSLLGGVMVVDPQSDVNLNAAGTGPFRVDSLTPGLEMRLVRNPQYWRPDRPYLDGIILKSLPDADSALINLQAGAVHMFDPIRNGDVKLLAAGTETSVIITPSGGNYVMLINTADPPFNDQRVRQALDLALDRKRFSETLLDGVGDPTHSMWPKTSPVWDASIDADEFNLSRARQLLADAGYANGFETKIQTSNNYPAEVQFDQIIQSDLAQIGITASIEVVGAAEGSALKSQATFPALLTDQYVFADLDPALAFTAFPFRPVGNSSRFQDDRYTQLVDAARREPDADTRLALYRQIGAFVKDRAFALPLAINNVGWGVRSNVHGVSRGAVERVPVFEDAWLG
jgi:peptide/nickel transport system substrate-binding protein